MRNSAQLFISLPCRRGECVGVVAHKLWSGGCLWHICCPNCKRADCSSGLWSAQLFSNQAIPPAPETGERQALPPGTCHAL